MHDRSSDILGYEDGAGQQLSDPQQTPFPHPEHLIKRLQCVLRCPLQRLLTLTSSWELEALRWNETVRRELLQVLHLVREMSQLVEEITCLPETESEVYIPVHRVRHRVFNKLNIILNGATLLVEDDGSDMDSADVAKVLRIIVNSCHALEEEIRKPSA